MIHRALFGSFERFIGILLEHYAGELPLWLAPVQAIVLPIADRHDDSADEVRRALRAAGLRAEVDDRTESVGRKIRDAELQQDPLHARGRRSRGRGRRGRRRASIARATRGRCRRRAGAGASPTRVTRETRGGGLYRRPLTKRILLTALTHFLTRRSTAECRSLEGSTGARRSGTPRGSTSASAFPRSVSSARRRAGRGQANRRRAALRAGARPRPRRGGPRGAPARVPHPGLLEVQVRADAEAEGRAQAPAADHDPRDQVPPEDRRSRTTTRRRATSSASSSTRTRSRSRSCSAAARSPTPSAAR